MATYTEEHPDRRVTGQLLRITLPRTPVNRARKLLLDVCCVDLVRDRKWAIIVSPHQGAKDGPTQPYPTPRPNGRRPHGALLSHRRRLRSSQPQGQQLPSHKAALG